MINQTAITSIAAAAALAATPVSAQDNDGAEILELIGTGAEHQAIEIADCAITIRTTSEGPAGPEMREARIDAGDVDTEQVHLATAPDGEVAVQLQLRNRQELDTTLHYLGDNAEERAFIREFPGATCGETGPCSAPMTGYFVASIVIPGEDASDSGWDVRNAIRDFTQTCAS